MGPAASVDDAVRCRCDPMQNGLFDNLLSVAVWVHSIRYIGWRSQILLSTATAHSRTRERTHVPATPANSSDDWNKVLCVTKSYANRFRNNTVDFGLMNKWVGVAS